MNSTEPTHAPSADAGAAPTPQAVAAVLDALPTAAAYARVDWDAQGAGDVVLLYANAAMAQQIGFRPVAGQSLAAQLPAGMAPQAQYWESILQVARTGQPIALEHYHQRLAQWFSITAYSPSPGHVIGLFEQITQRKDTEQKVRLYESIVQSSHDAIFSQSLDGTITSWNDKAQSLFGYAAQEIAGQPVSVLVPAAQRQEEQGILQSVAQGRSIEALETSRIHKNGSLLQLSVTISPVHDAQGQVVGASHIARDISERKSAANALAQSEQKWRGIVRSSPIALALVSPVGEITFLNEAFTSTFGYTQSDVPTLDRWWQQAYPDPAYRQWVTANWTERLQAAMDTQKPFQELEVQICCKNQQFKTVLATAAALGDDGASLAHLVDISDLVAARQSVRDTLHYADTVINSVGEGLCHIDTQGQLTFINPVGARLLGCTPEQAIGRNAHQFFHHTRADGSPYPEEECTIQRAATAGEARTSDTEVFWRMDGSSFPVHYVSAPMRVNGESRGSVVTFRDISETVRNRKVLLDNQIQIRKAQEMAGFGSYSTDFRSGTWKSDAQLDAIFGIDADFPHTVDNWIRIVAPEFRQSTMEHFAEVARGERDFRMDYRIVRPSDGVSRWVAANGELERDADGTPVRLIGTIQDVTQRKEIEEALMRSHELLMKLSEEIPGAMYQFHMSADGVFSVPFSSRGLAEIFGVAGKKISENAAAIFDAIVEEDREAVMASIQQSAQTLQTWNEEFRVRHGERVVWVQGQARPERQPDGGVMWHGFTHDVSDRIDTKNLLQQLNETLEVRVQQRTRELAQALESAEFAKRSRGEFLAKMSHEIRTPLNAVLGMTYLALKADPPPALVWHLQRIRDSGRHLLGIINDILDFSKIDAGKLELDTGDFELHSFLQRVMQLVEGRAAEKGLQLSVQVAPDVPTELHGDSLRLGQILVNYLNNAIKFTPQGEVQVQIHLADSESSMPKAARHLICFEVHDTGLGMPPEQLPRLFQPFEQGDNSTTRKYGGTGLGLVICKQLAQMMGGEVGVRSELGRGSTFWFTAQFDAAQEADNPISGFGGLATVTHAYMRGKRILVVDDNEFNLDVAKGLLELVGVQVVTAGDGEQALAALEREAVDAVLMDIHMPVMDGLDATQHIRAQPHWEELPVLAMTANAREEDRMMYLSAGLNDVVIKPIDPELLYQKLLQWLPSEAGPFQPSMPAPLGGTGAGAALPAEPAATPAWSTLAVWDRSQLERAVGSEVSTHVRLLQKFLAGARQQVQDMDNALQSQDAKLAGAVGHKLKSSARTVGALRLGAVCEAMEKKGAGEDMLGCQALCREIQQVFPESVAAIEQWLALQADYIHKQ